ncbi:ComEC/Rec2 family competence protein [Microbacterium paraoxydans]|uniref:ComEC/Rec2 family competence protein n=1 Tax=Microbacterium paraoxydans TaxID=199592 RepID=UPI0021A34917|nr:ComEC/Rec2 family competence protein [Microbacterium paraoxydans]MCT2223563.1 ComEC/Rec2 family competence protein [Microbacterium paraoxydans]
MTRDLRLLPVAVGAWGVALVCVFVPGAAAWVAGGCLAAAGIIGAALAIRRRAVATIGGLVIVVLATAAAVAFTVFAQSADRDAVHAWGGRAVEAVGEVSSSASVGRDGRLWMDVQLSGIGAPGAVAPAAGPVRIGIEEGEGFVLGAQVRVTGESAQTDPGERAVLVVFVTAGMVEGSAPGLFGFAADLRRSFVERATRLPEPGAGLLPGLAVGDTTAVPAAVDVDMRTSGLSHLTAVSGANCAVVVAAVFGIVALSGGTRALRVVLADLALAAFVVLVTPEPSVIRAATMAAAGMLSILVGRPSAGAGILALCVGALLVADPWLASTPGFALSAVASGALILLAPALANGIGRWLPGPLALAIAVPLAAQLACAPVIALFAEQQSLVSVVANLLAEPAAPIATVIGLLACLAAPLPPVADLLAACAWLPSAWIATVAHVTSGLPGAQVLLPAGLGSAALVALVSVAIAIVCCRGRPRPDVVTVRSRPRGTSTSGGVLTIVRCVAAGVLIVVASVGTSRALVDGPLAPLVTPHGWAIAACDVGQGDAILVRSQDAIALIDTGPDPAALDACLRSLSVDRIDLLVLTHFDTDHVGGAAVLEGRVDTVLHGPPADDADARVLDDLARAGAALRAAGAGDRGALGEASWRVLWPRKGSVAFPSGNDASVVTEFAGGGVPRALFLGDLSAVPQRALFRGTPLTRYDVVKVAHHGSADQEPALYEALQPSVALITVGAGNDYGHPRRETLEMLSALGAHVYRTDHDGRTLLGIEDHALRVWTDVAPP